jgi:hypothetical protein
MSISIFSFPLSKCCVAIVILDGSPEYTPLPLSQACPVPDSTQFDGLLESNNQRYYYHKYYNHIQHHYPNFDLFFKRYKVK